MVCYFDSSAAVKSYALEKGSAWVKSVAAPASGNTIHIAEIGIVEVAAALSKKLRTKELLHIDYESALSVFLSDIATGRYVTTPLSTGLLRQAIDLTRRHPLRGYDATHLATAMTLNMALVAAGQANLVFVCSDDALCQAAQAEGLAAENPNTK